MASRYPVSTVSPIRQAMDRLVTEAVNPTQFSTIWSTNGDRERTGLAIDAYATENEVVVIAAIPGIASEELEITIEKNTLTISGTIPNVARSEHAKGATWYLHELPTGSFRRLLTLPQDVDSSAAEATVENGVLRLVLPKSEAAKPRQIKVQSAQPKESPAIEVGDDETPEPEVKAEATSL